MFETEDRVIVGTHCSSPLCINTQLSLFENNVVFPTPQHYVSFHKWDGVPAMQAAIIAEPKPVAASMLANCVEKCLKGKALALVRQMRSSGRKLSKSELLELHKTCVRKLCTQHKEFAEALEQTGDKLIISNFWPSFNTVLQQKLTPMLWRPGLTGNIYGEALMAVRREQRGGEKRAGSVVRNETEQKGSEKRTSSVVRNESRTKSRTSSNAKSRTSSNAKSRTSSRSKSHRRATTETHARARPTLV